MKQTFILIWILNLFCNFSVADSLSVCSNNISIVKQENLLSENHKYTDTKKIIPKNNYPLCHDSIANDIFLQNEMSPFGKKFLRGSFLTLSAQNLTLAFTFVLPENFSNWKISTFDEYLKNFKTAYTKPPIIDNDVWYVNYLGHPYQGANYYNAYRSQGAKIWQCALLTCFHSVFWEYVLEAGFERPSIQDLIVTPVAGSLVGELIHISTIKMSKNGFKWYEKAIVCIINPMYAINNGFKK